ncbi:putative type I site-speicific deoxyribonuclease specificity subunit [Flavobacteria bacterium BBFL7]|nr:putative type I site-speicific deoxyribonuclease specificity subunit [Flavobacteria bacterium BBFL7]
MEKELPKGWVETNISSLVDDTGLFKDGDWVESKDQDPNGNVRLIQLADIGLGNFRDKSQRFLNQETAERLNCNFLEQNDILVARMPDPIGRSCLFPLKGENVTVVDVAIIRPSKKHINYKWLSHWINSPVFHKNISELASGSTRKRISRRNLDKIPFPLPPRAEQDRIVAKVDALMAQHAAIQQAMERIPQLLKDFRQQVLNQSFERNIERVALEDCCHKIQDGAHHSPKYVSPIREKNMFPYVTSKNIRNDYMKLDTLTYVNEDFHNTIYPRCSPEFGDVLLTKDGASTGNVTLNEFDEPISLLSSVCLIKTDKKKLIPAYLKYFIQSSIGFSEFTGKMTGTAIKRVVLKKIKKATIPLPSVPEQQEIVRRVESLFEKATAIEQRYEQLKLQIDSLPQAILHKAFKGELVEQLDSDGSAVELLEQIKNLKSNSNLNKKSKAKSKSKSKFKNKINVSSSAVESGYVQE